MTTKVLTALMERDANEDISNSNEELDMKNHEDYRPRFHLALKLLKSYPISALGLTKDTKMELVRKYGYKNLYNLFTDPKVFLNPRLRKKSQKELKIAIASFVHETEEVLAMMLYCPIIAFIGDMLPKSDIDKLREDT